MAYFSRNIKIRGLSPLAARLVMMFGLFLFTATGSTGALAAEAGNGTGDKTRAANVSRAIIKSAHIAQRKKQDAVLSLVLNKAVKYKVFTLQSPHRVVIDLQNTRGELSVAGKKPAFLKKLRHASRNRDDLRIVLDLTQAVTPKVVLKNRGRNKELRVMLAASGQTSAVADRQTQKKPLKKIIKPQKKGRQPGKNTPRSRPAPVAPARPAKLRRGDFIVAIDAGHGGKDPGAIGVNGSREKDIALQISRRLKQKIDRAPGMRAVLIRDGDYYIPLRKRMQIARKHHADLFISIHADANPNRHLTGSSVYILSENGASSEAARWLASSENAYESKLGGTSLQDKDNTLASMLMDLSQAATIDNSLTLANNTLRELGRVTRLLHRNVESAAFVVLKSPDIPSILVETAFISNPAEERRLNTAEYQNKLANAVFKGVRRFQIVHAPGGKLKMYANNGRRHIVKPGDSLSEIAKKYGVSANSLSHHNNLSSSTIRVGQKLYIPTRS